MGEGKEHLKAKFCINLMSFLLQYPIIIASH